MDRLPNLMAFLRSQRWAMEPSYAEMAWGVLLRRASGEVTMESTEIAAARLEAAERRAAPSASSAIAVLSMTGVIGYRMHDVFAPSSGMGTSTELLARQLRDALANPQVGSILIDTDSPGGMVTGTLEMADLIYRSRGQKPIVALANGMMASAAYYIGAAADEVVAIPSGEVGSIGTVMVHQDLSAALEKRGVKVTLIKAPEGKATGNPFEPLSEESHAHFQQLVDASTEEFVTAVAKFRGVSRKKVEESFGQGRMVMAEDALAAGMVDRIETPEDTLARMQRGKVKRRAGPSAGPAVVDLPEDPATAAVGVEVERATSPPEAGVLSAQGSPESLRAALNARRHRTA